MPQTPAWIVKDTTVVLGGENQIGQMQQLTLPVAAKTTEEIRAAGMVKPRLVTMGYEATSFSIEMNSFDPDVLILFGAGPHDVIARGYMESEDGSEHAARVEMELEFTNMSPGDWATASKASLTTEATVHAYTLFIEDNGQEREIWHMSDTEVRIGGVLQQPGRRRALGLV
ncbi:phage major tail tube protein [Roseovarius confluentis]|uniref:phage major tail tube protein n=1 Tax=Roseovarius confluentis TaxID=1852027 RepID=UPI003BA9CE28